MCEAEQTIDTDVESVIRSSFDLDFNDDDDLCCEDNDNFEED